MNGLYLIDAGAHGLDDLEAAESEAAEQAKALPPVLTDEQVQVYTAVGGTPHLDGQYTVFGEVVSGLDIVEQIQQTETLRPDRGSSPSAIRTPDRRGWPPPRRPCR